MYRYNIIGFFALCVVWIGSSFYFSTQIEQKENEYMTKKELVIKYTNLKDKYSKKSIKENKKKIIEFLDIFNIKYKIKKSKRENRDILSMELKKSNLNKVATYIINSNIEIYKMKIEKIDKYKVSFEVVY